jgi:hypothetical protein
MSCPDCGINRKFQEFIPNDYGIELSEEIERKECPESDCKSKNFSVFMAEKDTFFYPSPPPKREGKYRVLTKDGKCSCGSKQGYDKEEWHFQPGSDYKYRGISTEEYTKRFNKEIDSNPKAQEALDMIRAKVKQGPSQSLNHNDPLSNALVIKNSSNSSFCLCCIILILWCSPHSSCSIRLADNKI